MFSLKSAMNFSNYIRPISRSITTNLVPTSMGFRVLDDITPRSQTVCPLNPILILGKVGTKTKMEPCLVLGYSGQDGKMAERIMENGAPFQRVFIHHDRRYCRRFAENWTGRIFTFGVDLRTFTELANHLGITNYSYHELLYSPEKLDEVLSHPKLYRHEDNCMLLNDYIDTYSPLRELVSKNLIILDAKIPNKQEETSLDESLATHQNEFIALAERLSGPSLEASPYNLIDYI